MIYNENDVKTSIKRVAKKFKELSSTSEFVSHDNGGTIIHTKLQAFFQLKFNNEIDNLIRELIVTHAFNAEKMGPGSFERVICVVTEHILSASMSPLFDSTKSKLVSNVVPPTIDDINWLLSEYAKNSSEIEKSMISKALELAGFAGRIVIEKSYSNTFSIEKINGYTFNVNPGFSVMKSFKDPKIIAIDGFIEGVHEINQLLEDSSKSKEPVLLFIRGVSNDVLNTLSVNYVRGTLTVIPIVVKFDFEGLNTLADISILTGCDLKSTAKGDLISSARLLEAPTINSATIYDDSIILMHDKNVEIVHNHVIRLRERRDKESDDSMISLFDKRIKSLSSNYVVIRIPHDQHYVKISQTFDYVFRAFRSMLNYGLLKEEQKMLASTSIATVIHSQKCLNQLNNLGAVVI